MGYEVLDTDVGRITKAAGFRTIMKGESIEKYRLLFSEYAAGKGDLQTALELLPYNVGEDKNFVISINLLPDSYSFRSKVETAALLDGKKNLLNLVRQTHNANK